MPRAVRKKSESEIYHVMLRGINKQQIFFDEEDNDRFITILREYQEEGCFRLYAYCLMENHVHLLLRAEKDPLEVIMKRIGVRYVVWYNAKYERIGHLFQDRYRSEPIDSDAYFLTVLRYILNNPVKAGMCAKQDDYRLSSALDYYSGGGITDTAFAREIAGDKELIEFLQSPNEDVCLEDNVIRISDGRAQKIICAVCGVKQTTEVQGFSRDEQAKLIPALRAEGLSIRQISRLTGISVGIVRTF